MSKKVTYIKTIEITDDEDTILKLLSQYEGKLAAIKFIKDKKNLDLKTAKNIIDTNYKFYYDQFWKAKKEKNNSFHEKHNLRIQIQSLFTQVNNIMTLNHNKSINTPTIECGVRAETYAHVMDMINDRWPEIIKNI